VYVVRERESLREFEREKKACGGKGGRGFRRLKKSPRRWQTAKVEEGYGYSIGNRRVLV
jgi:hypothetical protein